MKSNAVLRDPNPASGGEAAGQNGVVTPQKVTSADLEAALAKMANPPAEQETTPSPAENIPPADAAQPEGAAQPETTPENEPPANEAAVETDLSQSETQAPALPPELAALPDDVRDQLIELAKEVSEGKTSFGQLKRGHRLNEEIQQLQQELEEARKTTPAPVAPGNLHPAIAKLNSESEVQAKRAELKALVKECRLHATGYTAADGNEITPEQIQRLQADAENQLDDLQDRAQQLQQQSWVKGEQAKVEGQVRKFAPEFFDDKSALGQKFKVLVNDPFIAQLPNRHFAAAAYALGEQQLLARLNKPAAAAAPAPKPGAVPKAKPAASAGGGAPPKPDATRAKFESVLPKPGQRVKVDDLERVLANMPPR